MRTMHISLAAAVLLTSWQTLVLAAAPVAEKFVPEDHRPSLFFSEGFTDEPTETPITALSLTNKYLLIGTYGPGKNLVAKSHHAAPKDDPGYVWLGSCTQVCGFTLKHKDAMVDLSGLAKVRWRTKQSGLHQLRLLLKLANGTLLVSDAYEASSNDWRESEISIPDVRWRILDDKYMNDGSWVDKPDLTKVDEIGWTDLQPGSGHGSGREAGSSRVDWVEVYGVKVPR